MDYGRINQITLVNPWDISSENEARDERSCKLLVLHVFFTYDLTCQDFSLQLIKY